MYTQVSVGEYFLVCLLKSINPFKGYLDVLRIKLIRFLAELDEKIDITLVFEATYDSTTSSWLAYHSLA